MLVMPVCGLGDRGLEGPSEPIEMVEDELDQDGTRRYRAKGAAALMV